MRKFLTPFGRLAELKNRPDADRLLLKPATGSFLNADYWVIPFASRKALEEFNKKARLRPVVFTEVPKNCAVWAHESDAKARALELAAG